MNFRKLKLRVERTEALVAGRAQQTQDAYGVLGTSWKEAWTPTRILVAGLVSGFIVGRTHPARAVAKLGKMGGPKWIQMISAVSGLVGSVQAAMAAGAAGVAAEDADDAADEAQDAAEVAAEADAVAPARHAAMQGNAQGGAEPMPAADRRRPDPVWSEQPRPAEAATEISER